MKKIDIKILKVMLISGANNLYNHHFEVDKLNVFPVPDGDTGTNMNLTMMNGIKELNGKEYDNLKTFATTFSHGLMMGARGNSGVILSQIFRGFFQVLKAKDLKNDVISNEDLLKSWKSAQEYAYRAVMKPVEGTILTIVKDGANYINEIEIAGKDFLFIFEKLLEGMNESLKRTPDLLPILKKVGVVDSGGAGLVYIVEGMVYGLKHGKAIAPKKKLEQQDTAKLEMVLNQENFGYCTEVIVKLNKVSKLDFNLNKTRTDLETMDGQSIVLVDNEDLIKVHVHTLKPGQILNYFQKFGEILKVKIENMTEQAKAHTQTIKPTRKLNNKFAIIAAVPGRGIETFFREELKVNNIIIYSKRINPSTDDFLKAIEIVDAKNIFILPNDSNLLLTAEQARKLEKKSKVFVLPAKNIAQGMRAALNFNPEFSAKENNKIMCSEIKNVAFGYITIADRDVEIDGIKIEKKHFFSAVSLRKDGKEKIVASNENLNSTIKGLFAKLIWHGAEIITIFKGKDYSKDQVNFIKKILDEDYDIEYEFIDGDQEVYNFLFVVE
ncbi:DAK2 domain-containing protein [Spiroplasma endosymbiont of Polydrusus pterygomalis]|uniref:DAK2 domain-containing protein n=1 Tax=Spiroplasma endosymbiont of Polydrusus pterygomalis TaxID=3139327 RepID=UPI003CCB2864